MKREFSRPLVTMAVLLAAASSAITVHAQESAMLSKPDVDKIVATKRLAFVRDSDQKKIEYDLRDGHAFYSLTTQGGRNLTISGTYEVGDDGKLCFKWNPDRYVNLPDGCYVFKHEGEKTLVARGPNGRIGELVP